MAIPPEKQQQIAQDVAQTFYDRHLKALRSIWNGEGGGLPFVKAKPQARLNAYIAGTLGGPLWLQTGMITSDLALVIQPDYPKRKRAGELPELQCIQAWRVYQAQQNGVQQQVPQPPVGQPPPLMWVFLSELPDEVFSWVSTDVRALLNEYDQKRAELVA